MSSDYDVLIIGGGPAGSTAGSLLAKYAPRLRIGILEREKFPREHVGESQLPLISKILHEMGVWEKVEAAGFPIKIGGTYRWGRTDELWDFDFIKGGKLTAIARPGTFTGQRQNTAFQVDRAIYDEILLTHAQSMGCEVRQATPVREVKREGDRVEGLVLEDGSVLTARHYIDASGNSGILRRTMQIDLDTPSNLQNIAIWNYWTDAEWAVTIGHGGTRVQILSQKIGWIWFIPVGRDRTSIGLIVPAEYYKRRGVRPEDLYYEAVQGDRLVSRLIANAKKEAEVRTTKDWSYVAERLAGENWFLAGECAGFADPILSAGMSLSQSGAREVAYAILALDRGEYEADWIKRQYTLNHSGHIRQHIRFADYWYTAHGAFSDLKDHAAVIAGEAGLQMSSEEAWQWLGQGGFIDTGGGTDIGFFGSLATKELISSFTGQQAFYAIEGKTHFKLNLDGAEKDWVAQLSNGRMTRYRSYTKGKHTLPVVNTMGWTVRLLKDEMTYAEIRDAAKAHAIGKMTTEEYRFFWSQVVKSLEALVSYGWAEARMAEGFEACPRFQADLDQTVHPNRDIAVDSE
ncbi:MAG: NAD(P)/FAD-dependent oxidoreductase [Fimbriimonas sp.]|nr:NAD(P)/FAD-dependent oxidoreductase [Fimbriimonas sp.]